MNKSPIILLAHPQMGENIGACARAMKNFGLNQLRIIRPRDGWPNPKAVSTAVGAADLIENAQIFESLNEAIADLEYLYGTTDQKRDMNKEHILSKNLRDNFADGAKVGILFGRESCGLNNDEISLCNKIITIDTNEEFSSLNIAQALTVIAYELFTNIRRENLDNPQILATKEDLWHFYNHLFDSLERKNFFKIEEKKNHMKKNIINLFSRIEKLSKNEVQTLRGIIKILE